MSAPVRLEFHRSLSDWSEAEDGSDIRDYGWSLMLYVGGKHRARWTSTRGTTRMWPHVSRGTDENCNRAVTFHGWPIGHLDVWWEPNWRTDADGICDECRALSRDVIRELGHIGQTVDEALKARESIAEAKRAKQEAEAAKKRAEDERRAEHAAARAALASKASNDDEGAA